MKNNLFVNFPQTRGPDLIAQLTGKTIVKSQQKFVATSVRTRQNFQAQALGDFHDRVSSAARAWGHEFSSEALWSYHIGTVFKSIQLSIYIYRVCNHHLVLDIHQMIGGLHNLYTFQWAIKSCLSYVGLRTSRHACRLVVANVTFQYPAAPPPNPAVPLHVLW